MGVPNSREYNYYQVPNSPLKILLKSKYRFLSGVEKVLSCFLLLMLMQLTLGAIKCPRGVCVIVFTNVFAVIMPLCSGNW